MPDTRLSEIEQLRAEMRELKNRLSAQAPDELQQLRATVAQMQMQISNPMDLHRIPDPIKDLSEFTGNKIELNAWLEELSEIYNLYKIKGENGNPDTMNAIYIRAIKNKIKGDARTTLCVNGNPNTIPSIIKVLKDNYGDQRDFATNLSVLFQIKKGERNHPRYFSEVRELNTKLKINLQTNPMSPEEIVELISVTRYLDNIDEPLASIIRSRQPKTLEDAYHFVSISRNADTRNKQFKKFHSNKPATDTPHKFTPQTSQTNNKKPWQNPFKARPQVEANTNETTDDISNYNNEDDDDDETAVSDTEQNFQHVHASRQGT